MKAHIPRPPAVIVIACSLIFGLQAIGGHLRAADAGGTAEPIEQPARATAPPPSTSTTDSSMPVRPRKHADFTRVKPSDEARHLADWVVESGNNSMLPFVIIDKVAARAFVFYPSGKLRGAAPVLLGQARGDISVPGIGARKMAHILPSERITPAGRFVATRDRNLRGDDILWVDYDAAISLHPVHTNRIGERRLQRLETPTPLDNRISYGCINVPTAFYNSIIRPSFNGTNGIVYILPENGPAAALFGFPHRE
jgi:hypothetical protein